LMKTQADLMKTQADLMERQANLMEAPFDQWVTLTDWATYIPRRGKLPIHANIINDTDYPLKLSGTLKLENPQVHSAHWQWELQDVFIAPHKPLSIDVDVDITEAQEQEKIVNLIATANYWHLHRISGRKVEQPYEAFLRCAPSMVGGPWEIQIQILTSMNPTHEEEAEKKAT